ncbi:MAG: hypothetical protein IPQ07_38045 [Myxococcales bacterium]|nr:hypothetical protein [Myxococcales bacterium]
MTDLVFRNTDLLSWFENSGRVKPNDGGAPFEWNILASTSNSAEIYVESQGLPTIGQPDFKRASVPAVYFRAFNANTGHIRDQVARKGVYANPIQTAVDDALKQLRTLIDSTLAGSAANRGIASIIDAGDVYGGLDPATVTQWAALETAVGGAMTIAVLNTLYRTLTDSPRGANPDTVLANINQLLNYGNLFGFASSSARSQPRQDMGKPYDLGIMKTAMSFNGAEFVGIRSLANSELYMLDAESGIELREQRELQIDRLAKVNDDEQIMASQALVPVVFNRRKHGKLTGVTA